MNHDVAAHYGDEMRNFLETLLEFESFSGAEKPAQDWLKSQFDEFGFEVYEWTANPEQLAEHPAYPDDLADRDTNFEARPSVAGVVEFGNPDEGRTIVLNGHVDVVPATDRAWESDPFEPTWDGDELTARGVVDMKSGLVACIFAARHLAATTTSFDGRLVVESVAGEEDLGLGASAAAVSNPYPFERDAAIFAEPSDLRLVRAVDGALMKRLRLHGNSAHAGLRWQGESVLPHFERIRAAFMDLETERSENVSHPLYTDLPIPAPVNVGTVEAGDWAASVPSTLEAELRISVPPGDSIERTETQFHDRLDSLVAADDWLSEHPPTFERFSVQFEPAAVEEDEPIVNALQRSMRESGLTNTAPKGMSAGADSRQYVHAGIPAIVFGPGNLEQAHFPNETIHWPDVKTATAVIAKTAVRFLAGAEHK